MQRLADFVLPNCLETVELFARNGVQLLKVQPTIGMMTWKVCNLVDNLETSKVTSVVFEKSFVPTAFKFQIAYLTRHLEMYFNVMFSTD